MKVYIITSAKFEELYLEDWIKHSLSLGIDKIIINDNNPKDYKYQLKDILKKYIDNGQVIIERYYDEHELTARSKERELNKVYSWLYNKYKNEFDWCCRLDIDEYLQIPETNNDIHKYLLKPEFINKKLILVPWKEYSTIKGEDFNDALLFRNVPVYLRNLRARTQIKLRFKSIIRSLEETQYLTWHAIDNIDKKDTILTNKIDLKYYSDLEIKLPDLKLDDFTSFCYIKHYRLLSLEERLIRFNRLELEKYDDQINGIKARLRHICDVDNLDYNYYYDLLFVHRRDLYKIKMEAE